MHPRQLTRTALLLVLALLVSGCSLLPGADRPTKDGTPVKNVDPRGMRSELEPLTSRFPALGQPVSAQWQSGTLGDDRAPGPSTYWIDAVVTLDRAVADELRDAHALTSGGAAPELADDVAAKVPDGELTRSDALDTALSHDGWDVDAWLVEGQDVIVLSAVGD